MDQNEKNQFPQDRKEDLPTPLWKRAVAIAGVILMLLLVLLYAYSLATGSIFAW